MQGIGSMHSEPGKQSAAAPSDDDIYFVKAKNSVYGFMLECELLESSYLDKAEEEQKILDWIDNAEWQYSAWLTRRIVRSQK